MWFPKCKFPSLNVKNPVEENTLFPLLLDVVKKAEKKPINDDDDLKVIRTAIDFESKGMAYYAKIRDEVIDPKEKEFFDLLSKIEHEHHLSLKDTEESLANPDSWYVKTNVSAWTAPRLGKDSVGAVSMQKRNIDSDGYPGYWMVRESLHLYVSSNSSSTIMDAFVVLPNWESFRFLSTTGLPRMIAAALSFQQFQKIVAENQV